MRIVHCCACSSPAIRFINVVFPLHEGPIKEINDHADMVSDVLFKIGMFHSGVVNVLLTFSKVIIMYRK